VSVNIGVSIRVGLRANVCDEAVRVLILKSGNSSHEHRSLNVEVLRQTGSNLITTYNQMLKC
jgi:hypothetical protein